MSTRRGQSHIDTTSVCAAIIAAMLCGCVATKSRVTETSVTINAGDQILLMPLDIQLSELTASGLQEVNAEWSQTGLKNVHAALRARLSERNIELIDPAEDLESLPREDPALQLVKLHGVVGEAILLHSYQSWYELPTLGDSLEWTLGDEARLLQDRYGADYALFVYFRDSFSNSGRVALMVVGAALGAAVPGGQQRAFASLVDVQTGRVQWFNLLQSSVGDLRRPDSARKAVENLLEDAPL